MRWYLRVLAILHRELGQFDLWWSRVVVLTYAVLTGLSIVLFARTTDWSLSLFFDMHQAVWWSPWSGPRCPPQPSSGSPAAGCPAPPDPAFRR
jgi:hypothetical protein